MSDKLPKTRNCPHGIEVESCDECRTPSSFAAPTLLAEFMTTKEAIERLDSMQSQIIHGKRTFGDIADVIRNLEAVRIAALAEVCRITEQISDDSPLCKPTFLAHRILACSDPAGVNDAPVTNSANKD
jgi:hypothetical protein